MQRKSFQSIKKVLIQDIQMVLYRVALLIVCSPIYLNYAGDWKEFAVASRSLLNCENSAFRKWSNIGLILSVISFIQLQKFLLKTLLQWFKISKYLLQLITKSLYTHVLSINYLRRAFNKMGWMILICDFDSKRKKCCEIYFIEKERSLNNV